MGAAAALVLPGTLSGCARALRAPRPNVVLIMTDDLGYGDVGFTGGTAYPTPHIDRIAHEGVILRQSYSAAPVCSPTRVALMTGRYPAREPAGLHEPLTRHPTGLPADPPTLPRLLKDAGYDTALVGKWHLGVAPEYHPLRHGFDEFYGFLGAAADYASKRDTEYRDWLFHDGETPVRPEGYLTDLLSARAERIIATPRVRPFFLSLQYNAPHWPWQGPGDAAYPDSISSKDGGSPETFAAMMRSLDDGVGRVLKALQDREISRETLVIFTSDNGGERFSHMGPFSHAKMTVGEGGIRVATAVRWPQVIPAGITSDQIAITMDWMPTFLSLAGTSTSRPLDGIDLLPALFGGASRPRELHWRVTQRRQQKAVRRGDRKFVVDEQGEHLYDLAQDPGERADLANRFPEEARALREALAAWEREMLPPAPLEVQYR